MTIRREALRFGLLGSIFALFGSTRARAAEVDALSIQPDGATLFAKKISFGSRYGEFLAFWPPLSVGVQDDTLYQRSSLNFAWYKGGKHSDKQFDPGEGGSKMMSLSDGVLTVSDRFIGKGAVPPGAILMWSGVPSQPPAGWVLCDGTNNALDLQGRFIVGYQPGHRDYQKIANTGGEMEHLLSLEEMPLHDHGSAGKHAHSFTISQHGWAFNIAQSGDPRQGPLTKADTDQAGDHVHQKGRRRKTAREPTALLCPRLHHVHRQIEAVGKSGLEIRWHS